MKTKKERPTTYICVWCGKGPFKGDFTICHNCKRKVHRIGPNGEKIKLCPKCGTEHTRPRGIFCSDKCAQSREMSIDTRKKMTESALLHRASPEGLVCRDRFRKIVIATNTKDKNFVLVEQDELLVDPPDPRTYDDYAIWLDGYDIGGDW